MSNLLDNRLEFAQCADEPIRTPGAIQPGGWLACVAVADRALIALSDNWADLLGCAPAGASIRLAEVLATLPLDLAGLADGDAPVSRGACTVHGCPLHVVAHRAATVIHLEFEHADRAQDSPAPIYSLVRHAVPRMAEASTVQALCAVAAQEMKALTGFGRCLIYRFDAEGHGEVLAEAADPGYASYANHHFPASDIPEQARALYRISQFRLIPSAHYEPVPVRFVADGAAAAGLDMSQCALRSVSPVHLEYMRNMGTLASMSVSIIVRGELWGLVSCHDHAPRGLSYPVRMACEHLGQLLSLQIAAKQESQVMAEQARLRHTTLAMVADLADSDATLQRLVDQPVPLLAIARASGAAVLLDSAIWTCGTVPDATQLIRLGEWLSLRTEAEFHTDRLGQLAPEFAEVAAPAAGVLAISVSGLHRHFIIWFRPERIQTIKWAGNPRKDPLIGVDGRLHPRRSFGTWREQIVGRSAAWSSGEVAAVLELRQALIGIVLRRAEEMAEVATELGRVNTELEAFSYTVSHDLRAPMRHIAGFVDLVLEQDGANLGERSRRYLGHVKDASAHAGQLVDALLDFSRMGRSSFKRVTLRTDLLVEELVSEQVAEHRGRRIEWAIEQPLPVLVGDPVLIPLAVRNLLSNAVKYTRTREVARIRVAPLVSAGKAGLEIVDNGVGFQMKYADKLFGVFQRLHESEQFEGTGIGLATVRRIVERHGGTVTAHGEPDRGARFGFVLPDSSHEQRADRASRKNQNA